MALSNAFTLEEFARQYHRSPILAPWLTELHNSLAMIVWAQWYYDIVWIIGSIVAVWFLGEWSVGERASA